MTLKKNTEYTVKLGVNSYEGGGPRGGINGGGGSAIIYEKAQVIAVCGGGGGAGTGGNGGDGGGCNVAGLSGQNGAAGGEKIVGDFPSNGHTQAGPSRNGNLDFDNGNSGSGRLARCTQGRWWTELAPTPTPPCNDVGDKTTPLYGSQGIEITSTTTGIQRGYKAGQGFRNNGGAGSGNGGGGGAGARGGQGTATTGGGGGGSGWIASSGEGGEIKLLKSTALPNNGTQVGGNNDVAFISIEAYSPSLDDKQEPFIPPETGNQETRTVNWNPSRNAGDRNTIEFLRVGGADNDRIRFGPNADQLAQNSQIIAGAVYQLFSANNENGRGLTLRIQNNQLQAADNPDNLNFSNLVIAPDQGVFSSGSTLPVKIQGTAGEGSNPQPNIRWTANW
jgi:hypothetical protein